MITDRIDAVTHIPDEYRNKVLPPPKSVKIELTGLCNFACSFCARSQKLRKVGEIDRTFFERIVKDMHDAGVQELGLFYLGESFMVDWLPEAIKYTKDIGFEYVFLTTNGSLASPDKVDACMAAGLDSLKFSYNYASSEQLHEIANVKESYFDKIQSNIKTSWAVRTLADYKCGLYASYIEYDGEQGEKMKRAVEEIKPYVDEVYALPLYNQAGFVTQQEIAKGMKPTSGNRGRLDNMVDGLPCWALFTEGHISWDGQLTGCCFSHTPDFDFGNLNDTSFMDAWNSDRAQWFRDAHLTKNIEHTPCAGCFS